MIIDVMMVATGLHTNQSRRDVMIIDVTKDIRQINPNGMT